MLISSANCGAPERFPGLLHTSAYPPLPDIYTVNPAGSQDCRRKDLAAGAPWGWSLGHRGPRIFHKLASIIHSGILWPRENLNCHFRRLKLGLGERGGGKRCLCEGNNFPPVTHYSAGHSGLPSCGPVPQQTPTWCAVIQLNSGTVHLDRRVGQSHSTAPASDACTRSKLSSLSGYQCLLWGFHCWLQQLTELSETHLLVCYTEY